MTAPDRSVREAAYESLLKTKRITLHARLLDVVKSRGDAAPKLNAQHAEAAGIADRGVGSLIRTAEHCTVMHLARGDRIAAAVASAHAGPRICATVGRNSLFDSIFGRQALE